MLYVSHKGDICVNFQTLESASSLVHAIARIVPTVGATGDYTFDDLCSSYVDAPTNFDYPQLEGSQAVFKSHPIAKFSQKVRHAEALEAKGNHEEALQLRMETLGLAKICDVICQPHEAGLCKVLIASAHFHLGRMYIESGLYKQAISHSIR